MFATDYCATPDPLRQLLTALCRTAMDQAPDDPLYLAFAGIMAKVSYSATSVSHGCALPERVNLSFHFHVLPTFIGKEVNIEIRL